MRPKDGGLRLNGGNGKFDQMARLAVNLWVIKKNSGRGRFQSKSFYIIH